MYSELKLYRSAILNTAIFYYHFFIGGQCHYHLIIIVVGDSCSAGDGCNTCYCDAVCGIVCTSDYCGGMYNRRLTNIFENIEIIQICMIYLMQLN